MLTWSLGCTPSPASAPMTSLAFMFVEVPEPVWKTSIGNWRVVLAGGDLLGGFLDARGAALGEQAELAVDGGGGALQARQPVDHGDGTVSPEIGKFSTAFVVSAAPQLLLRHRLSSGEPFLVVSGALKPYPQNAAQLAGEADGVVVGHQEARALEHAQLAIGEQAQRLFGAGERMQAVLVGPQQQHGHLQAGIELEQLRLRAPRPAARAPRPRAREAGVAGHVGEGVANEVGSGGVARAATARSPRSGVNTARAA